MGEVVIVFSLGLGVDLGVDLGTDRHTLVNANLYGALGSA